jgi:uridine kinase
VDAPEEQALPGSILLFDGIFLHRSELKGRWDFSVVLRVEWVRNHHVRSRPDGISLDVDEPRHHRYFEGQNIYFRECRPWDCASIVIDNEELAAPFIVLSEHTL